MFFPNTRFRLFAVAVSAVNALLCALRRDWVAMVCALAVGAGFIYLIARDRRKPNA
jgi:hypothetical protein